MKKTAFVFFIFASSFFFLRWGIIEGLADDVKSCHEYIKIGCYRDSLKKPRPLPTLITNYRSFFNWYSPKESISSGVSQCADAASQRGFTIFGLQFYGECWSGENASLTYARDGKSDRCVSAVDNELQLQPCKDDSSEACTGASQSNYVYKIIDPVNGKFTPWSTWGPCSKSCGEGEQKRTRLCSDPPPSKCGNPCIGDVEETTSCNTHSCPAPCLDVSSSCERYIDLGLCSFPEVLKICRKSCGRCWDKIYPGKKWTGQPSRWRMCMVFSVKESMMLWFGEVPVTLESGRACIDLIYLAQLWKYL